MVGVVCLAGFAVDVLALAVPLNLFDLPWRISVLQQTGDRSVILLFGVALLLYSQANNRRINRPLSLLAMGIGVAFVLSCTLMIRDSLILQGETLSNINSQTEQLRLQIEAGRASDELPANVTLEQLEQAAQQISLEAEQLKADTRTDITKSALAGVGNLFVVGLGLISLGRLGVANLRRIAS